MPRRHATEKVIWELAAFLGKEGWLIGPANPSPAIVLAGRWALSSAFAMVLVDGTARGSGDAEALLDHWSNALVEELARFQKGELSQALGNFVALCFCDLPEPLASDVLSRKRLRPFHGSHAFCRAIDFDEGTVREHAGIPYFSGYGTEEIGRFLKQWREFDSGGPAAASRHRDR